MQDQIGITYDDINIEELPSSGSNVFSFGEIFDSNVDESYSSSDQLFISSHPLSDIFILLNKSYVYDANISSKENIRGRMEINSQQYMLDKQINDISIIAKDSKSWKQEYGVESPSNRVLLDALQLIQKLATNNYFPCRVTPTIEEGICLVFKKGNYKLYLEIYNAGDTGYLVEDFVFHKIIESKDVLNRDFMPIIIEDFFERF